LRASIWGASLPIGVRCMTLSRFEGWQADTMPSRLGTVHGMGVRRRHPVDEQEEFSGGRRGRRGGNVMMEAISYLVGAASIHHSYGVVLHASHTVTWRSGNHRWMPAIGARQRVTLEKVGRAYRPRDRNYPRLLLLETTASVHVFYCGTDDWSTEN
jgi:hypothetical protein